MLNGDGNENAIKINRSNQQKTKQHVQHTIFFNQKKETNLHVQHACCLSLPLFCTTTTLFCRTKSSNFLVTHYFYGGIVARTYPIFCLLCLCNYYFSLPLIFTLLAASTSHCLTAALNFHVFLPKNSSLLFSVTRSSSFSVIHVTVNIKNNVEKDTTLLLFFLS